MWLKYIVFRVSEKPWLDGSAWAFRMMKLGLRLSQAVIKAWPSSAYTGSAQAGPRLKAKLGTSLVTNIDPAQLAIHFTNGARLFQAQLPPRITSPTHHSAASVEPEISEEVT